MDGNLLIANIRKLCKKHKVSITKLESDLFLSPGLISRWNKSIPAMDKVMDIAEYFGVSIDELVGRSKNFSDHTDIGRLLLILYHRSLTAEINWDILNFQDPPADLTNITSAFFSKNESCDCYFARYMNGFFFLVVTHSPFGDLQLALFSLPDAYSKPECACSDTIRLMQVYEYLDRRFGIRMNKMKSDNFIHAFMEDSNLNDTTAMEKVTRLEHIHEVSNF